ncbi:DUF6009 family protein [Streptomyces angustmyceticus]
MKVLVIGTTGTVGSAVASALEASRQVVKASRRGPVKVDPEGLYAKSAPVEAVDPRTLAPRVKGYKTERSEGGPPSRAMQEPCIQLPSRRHRELYDGTPLQLHVRTHRGQAWLAEALDAAGYRRERSSSGAAPNGCSD